LKLTKGRLEALSDGVMATVMTIMVFAVALPVTFDVIDILKLLLSVLTYFISFVVVASFWNSHHRVFLFVEKVTARLVIYNILFLFFLSLTPIFTEWVIAHHGHIIPAIAYDILFILVNLCNSFMFHHVIATTDNPEIKNMRQRREQAMVEMRKARKEKTADGATWLKFFILAAVFVVVIGGSILIPNVSTVFLLGIPVVFSVLSLLGGTYGVRRRRVKKATDKTKEVTEEVTKTPNNS